MVNTRGGGNYNETLFIITLSLFDVFFVSWLRWWCGSHRQAKTPSGSSVQKGRDYQDVIEDFEEHGFTNIQTEEIDDLITGWLTKEGEVEDVAINGDTDYSADKWVPADSEVLIRYHVFPKDEETEPVSEPTETPTTEPETSEAPTTEAPVQTEPTEIPAGSTFSIHYIDVGQADAALVECDGHYMLIDGGNKGDSNVIYSVLKKASVSKLDIVVGTHAHEDHIGGLPGAFNYTTADLTLCPVTSYDSDAFGDFKTTLIKMVAVSPFHQSVTVISWEVPQSIFLD